MTTDQIIEMFQSLESRLDALHREVLAIRQSLLPDLSEIIRMHSRHATTESEAKTWNGRIHNPRSMSGLGGRVTSSHTRRKATTSTGRSVNSMSFTSRRSQSRTSFVQSVTRTRQDSTP